MMQNNNGTVAPGACVTMPYFECRPGIYEIDEFDCTESYVVVGDKSALVVDTGTGVGDLRWLIEHKITDKPYEVVATHNHGDHIGGAAWFDSVWMHKDDLNWKDSGVYPDLEFRKDYARLITAREGKHYAYDPERDIRPWPKEPVFRALEDGHVFDLGGRTVTAYHVPGHTPGEIVLIDSLTKTLLCGDACNCNWLLNSALAPTGKECVEKALEGIKRIEDMAQTAYDPGSVFNFHHDFRGFGQELDPDVLPNLVKCLESIMDGTALYKEVPDPLSDCGETKTVAVCGDVMVSCMDSDVSKIMER
jgi:glyoxylase-like metal-dependent hydrolase (beta-lactamase superfamily II)